jgi:hypothetical protein
MTFPMQRPPAKPSAWELAGAGALVFLLAANVFRAWTQSITVDEAITYNQVLSGPLSQVLTDARVNNHVLQSALSWISVHLFGLSEFSLRLPSVLAGALYFAVIWRLSQFCFGRGPLVLLSILALAGNPFVLDYLSAARGYGLGLALFFWAFEQVFMFLAADREPRRLYRAGIGLGLAVAANLVISTAAAALGLVLAIALARERRGFWQLVDGFAGPALVTGFVILALPVSRLERDQFYYGSSNLSTFAFNLADLSFAHKDVLVSLGYHSIRGALAGIVLPLLFAAIVAAGLLALWRWPKRTLPSALAALTGGTLVILLAAVVALHHGVNLLYPLGRTGICWAPLFTLGCLALVRWPPGRAASAPLVLFLLASVGTFALGFTTNYYSEWKFDSGTKRAVNMIRAREAATGRRDVSVTTSSFIDPSTAFYRTLYHLDWMRPIPGGGADRLADYYLLWPADHSLLAKRNLRTILSDRESGLILAIPQ